MERESTDVLGVFVEEVQIYVYGHQNNHYKTFRFNMAFRGPNMLLTPWNGAFE